MMKASFFYTLILIAIFSSGCTGFLKGSEKSDTKKHIPVTKNISPEKETAPPAKTHQKSLMLKTTKEKIERNLVLAEKCLDEKKYNEIPAITKKILAIDPSNEKASALENEAYYMAGKALHLDHHYIDSLKMFGKINKDYKDVKKIEASIRTKMKKESEICYKKGVKHFINEELQKAIAEWEKTLILNPEHPKAEKDIENAKHLLKQLEKIK
ncbi:MAG: hypothetical protein JRF40_04455 [Deltaproteobacteria bacterium]|nr:hypothetical protein [Deltaproteobacteria bacterium]